MPQLTLKKKLKLITYHPVHEGSTRDEWQVTYVNTLWNIADLLTKPLPYGEKKVCEDDSISHIW